MFPGEKVYWQENSSSSCCLSDVDGGRLCGEDRADRETSGHRIYGDREAGHSGRIRGNDCRAKGRRISTSYADQGELYLAVGYGTRPTSGYSIKVKALYETENAVYIQTELLGPSKEEKITEKQTYPYVVVKMEWIDKNIIFE